MKDSKQDGTPFGGGSAVTPPRYYFVVKRIFDALVAFLLIVFEMPLLLIIALAIKLSSPGPALIKEHRIGEKGRPITLIKFRTMYVDASHSLDHRLTTQELVEASSALKLIHDPRFTRMGRFLSRTGLDFLPLLCNVVRGDLSFVGSAPILPYELDLSPERYRELLLCKPGIVPGILSQPRDAHQIEVDIRYCRSRSLWGDLRIITTAFFIVMVAGWSDPR